MQTLSATVAHTTYSREEYPVVLPATDSRPAVVAIPGSDPFEPDYCTGTTEDGKPLGEFLLAWDSRSGWGAAWRSHDTNNVDTCGHVIDPERAALAANYNQPGITEMHDSQYLERWLNMCSPEGVTYRVADANGHSQGDEYIYASAFPSDSAPSPEEFRRNAEFSEPVNWVRGTVSRLAFAVYNEEDDIHELDYGICGGTVYGKSWNLDKNPYAKETAEEFALNNWEA